MFSFDKKFFSLHMPAVMGILNITPDSFSDGGKYNTENKAVLRSLEMQSEGASLIDIGAQSTRPGAKIISDDKELERLFPIFNSIRQCVKLPLSVDTFYPKVAKKALKNGADIINDVSGSLDDEMLRTVKDFDAGIVIMHRGNDISNIKSFFEEKLNQAEKIGISKNKLCFDPGIGFGKKQEDNIKIIRNPKNFKIETIPILIGLSKKSVLSYACKNLSSDKISATVCANIIAYMGGADILRVHDVKQNVDAVNIFKAIMESEKIV